MDTKQLARGNALQTLIDQLKYQRENWDKAKSFHSIQAINDRGYINLVPDRVPIDVVKAIVLADYDKEIASLETEFNNL